MEEVRSKDIKQVITLSQRSMHEEEHDSHRHNGVFNKTLSGQHTHKYTQT